MKKNNKSFSRELIKFLKSKVDSKPTYGEIKFLRIDNDEPENGFIIKLNDKEYTLLIYDSHYQNENASFINLRDANRKGKNSLVQLTINKSNFIIKNNSFILKQNRVMTIGTKHIGLKEEAEKLMFSFGFNKDKIILQGEFNNTDFEAITKSLSKWLIIYSTTKLQLEKKYRNIENETSDDEVILDLESKTEGGKRVVISIQSERDQSLKKSAIKLHGTTCKVCSFNFNKLYGKWAEEFIEVHHVRPLSATTRQVMTNPQTDLTVVCSNCHRMIHKKKGITLTVDELKNKLILKK